MKYLLWLFLPVLVFSQVRTVTQTGIKKTMIRGDLTVLTWDVPTNYTADSVSFVVKNSADPSGVRLIQKTTGAGNLTMSFAGNKTTISATINTNDTQGFTAATYYYDIYDYTDSVTLVTGILVIQEDVSSPADGVATSTPYYTVALDTPNVANTFLIGQDSTNIWYRRTTAATRTILGIDTLTGATLIPDSVVYPYEIDTLFTKTSHIINVKEFGAVGDSITDDSQAFENAITYIKDGSYGGMTLYIPKGIYRFTSKWVIQNLVGAKIIGEQGGQTFNYDGTILMWDGGNTDGFIEMNYVKNTTFEGIRFESKNATTSRAWFGIKFKDDNGTLISSSGNIFEKCYFVNFDTALAFGDHNYNNDYNASEMVVNNCYFQNNVIGIFNAGIPSGSQNVNNYISNTHWQAGTIGEVGVYIDGGHLDLFHCSWGASVSDSSFTCIYITGDRSLTQTMNIIGCYTEQTNYFIRTEYTATPTEFFRNSVINLVGNWIKTNKTSPEYDTKGFAVYKNMNLFVAQNIITDTCIFSTPTGSPGIVTTIGYNNDFEDNLQLLRTGTLIQLDKAPVNLVDDQTIAGNKTITDTLKFGLGTAKMWAYYNDFYLNKNVHAGEALFWDDNTKPNDYKIMNTGDWVNFYFDSTARLTYKISSQAFFFNPDSTLTEPDGSGAKAQFRQGDVSITDSTKGLMLKEESNGDWITLTGDSLDYLYALIPLPDTTGITSGYVPKYQGDGTILWQSDATGAGGAAYTDSVTIGGRHVPGDSLMTIIQIKTLISDTANVLRGEMSSEDTTHYTTINKVIGLQDSLNKFLEITDLPDSIVYTSEISGDTSDYTITEMDSLLALAGKSIDTLVYHWGVMDTVTIGDLIAYKVESNITIIKVSTYSTTDSVRFNIQERASGTPNTAGDSLFASPMWSPTTARDSTSFSGSGGANFAKNTWIMPVVNETTDATRFGITVWAIKQSY